jgi:hypothetical protein
MRHDDLRGQPSGRSPVGLSHCLGIETASQSSLAKADELGWTVVSMKEDWSTVYGKLTDQ